MNPEMIANFMANMETLKTELESVQTQASQEGVEVQVQFSYNGISVAGNMPKKTADAIAQWVQMFN